MIGFEFDYHLEFASYHKKVVVNMVQNVPKRLCSKILGWCKVSTTVQGVSVTKCFDKHL